MCVVILADRGSSKNSPEFFETIKAAADSNPDGIGYMFKNGGDSIVFEKGFKTAEELIAVLEKLNLPEDSLLALHFRIGNKGAVNAEMCHPFVCSKDEETVIKLKGESHFQPLLMHNGTFNILNLPKGNSDTHEFAHRFMSNRGIQDAFYSNIDTFKEFGSNILGLSRILVFYPDNRDYQKLGNWIEKDGYFYSNVTFRNKNMINVGGKEVLINKESTKCLPFSGTKNTRPTSTANNRTYKSINNNLFSDLTDTTFDFHKLAYKRLSSYDIFQNIIKNTNSKERLDVNSEPYYMYRGLIKYPKRIYISDIVSLEMNINRFNFNVFNLLAKITDENLNIIKSVYYKIDGVHFNHANGKELISITRLVNNYQGNDPIYIDSEDINKYFTISKKGTVYNNNLINYYLDLVTYYNNTHKKGVNLLLNTIKGESDNKLVTIKSKKQVIGAFPVIVVKWFIHELKKSQNTNIKQIYRLVK